MDALRVVEMVARMEILIKLALTVGVIGCALGILAIALSMRGRR